MAVTLTPFAGLDNTTVENPEALYLVAGSGTDLDGKLIRAVALVDPATAQAMVPGSVTFSSLSIADGDDVAQGATTDAATANTVIGRLKKVLAVLPAALTGAGNLKTALQEALPAGANTIGGITVDAALPAGANTIGGVTVANGADAALGTTTDASSAPTVIGLLKALKAQTAGVPAAAQTASYSTTGAGSTVDTTDEPVLAFSLQVTSVTTGGTATSWTVLVEGSLDGTNWATVLTHAKPTDAESAIKHTVGFPVRYLRANVSALVLGVDASAISVSILGKS